MRALVISDSHFGAWTGEDLLREKLQGKRFVFMEGNHDHDLVTRDAESLVELELSLGDSSQLPGDALQRADSFRRFLQQRLEGVEVEIRYPTYTFGDVLCTHGHYLEVHARQHRSGPDRLLGRAIWSIAVGADHAPTLADYESTTTLLAGVHDRPASKRDYGAASRLPRIPDAPARHASES